MILKLIEQVLMTLICKSTMEDNCQLGLILSKNANDELG